MAGITSRLSDEDMPLLNDISVMVNLKCKSLLEVWDQEGLPRDKWEGRMKIVEKHVNDLMDEMINEEKGHRDRVMKNTATITTECRTLENEMGLDSFTPKSEKCVPLEEEMKLYLDLLKKKKDDRMVQLRALQQEENLLCAQLMVEALEIPSTLVPTLKVIDDIQKHISEMERELISRQSVLILQKTAAIDLVEELGYEPLSPFIRKVISTSEFICSDENMAILERSVFDLRNEVDAMKNNADGLRDNIRLLWQQLGVPLGNREDAFEDFNGYKPHAIQELEIELARLKNLKHGKMKYFVEKSRADLAKAWDLCHFDSEQRCEFQAFIDDNYTEELLESHLAEINRVMEFYSAHKHIFQAYKNFQGLFDKMVDFERPDKDRLFKHRGGELLQEGRERARVAKELPKVEAELKLSIDEAEVRSGEVFLFDGKPLMRMVVEQRENFEENKENEKKKKQEEKLQQHQSEASSMMKKRKRSEAAAPTVTLSVKRQNSTPASSAPIGNHAPTVRGRRATTSRRMVSARRRSNSHHPQANQLIVQDNRPAVVMQPPTFTFSQTTLRRL